MNRETALPTRSLESGAVVAQTQPWQTFPVTLESAAVSVMTDLTQVKAATIAPGATLRQAEQKMIYQGVRMLFVVDEMPIDRRASSPSNDLRGERVLRLVQHRGSALRADIAVADAMTPRAQFAGDRTPDAGSRPASAISSRRSSAWGATTCSSSTVVAGSRPRLRGVVSRSQIERQLGQKIEIVPVSSQSEQPRMTT
ncbi:MAG: hypothetical protein MZW92_62805 [Comamonadaceae bacterium]|nr:hypothetical protein [Comamonadaceae bacterium]